MVKLGQKFGKFTVLRLSSRTNPRHRLWACKCACGKICDVQESNLVCGGSTQCRSCGNRQRALVSNKDVSKLNWATTRRECPRCHSVKPLTEWKLTRLRSGRVYPSVCKVCRSELDTLDRVRYPEKYRQQEVKTRYALSARKFKTMKEKQGGVCAICKGQRKRVRSKLNVDHCHKTGKVRGLLCSSCNSLLGYAKDSVPLLIRAISYLRRSLV